LLVSPFGSVGFEAEAVPDEKGLGAFGATGGYAEDCFVWLLPFSDDFPAENGVGAFVGIGGKAAAEGLLDELATSADLAEPSTAELVDFFFSSNARSLFSGVVPKLESAWREASAASILFRCRGKASEKPFIFSWSVIESTFQSGLSLLRGVENVIRLSVWFVLVVEITGTPSVGERRREGPRGLAEMLSLCVKDFVFPPIRDSLVNFLTGTTLDLDFVLRTACSILDHFSILSPTSVERLLGVFVLSGPNDTGVNLCRLFRPLRFPRDEGRDWDTGVETKSEENAGKDSV
jgi:hypothetical protein